MYPGSKAAFDTDFARKSTLRQKRDLGPAPVPHASLSNTSSSAIVSWMIIILTSHLVATRAIVSMGFPVEPAAVAQGATVVSLVVSLIEVDPLRLNDLTLLTFLCWTKSSFRTDYKGWFTTFDDSGWQNHCRLA